MAAALQAALQHLDPGSFQQLEGQFADERGFSQQSQHSYELNAVAGAGLAAAVSTALAEASASSDSSRQQQQSASDSSSRGQDWARQEADLAALDGSQQLVEATADCEAEEECEWEEGDEWDEFEEADMDLTKGSILTDSDTSRGGSSSKHSVTDDEAPPPPTAADDPDRWLFELTEEQLLQLADKVE